MTAYPKKYDKNGFLKFLKKNNVNNKIITNFTVLPEIVEKNDIIYKLDINSIFYNEGTTYHNFELNYYSEDLIEYLFGLKAFNDIEVSINYLYCELLSKGYLNDGKCKL